MKPTRRATGSDPQSLHCATLFLVLLLFGLESFCSRIAVAADLPLAPAGQPTARAVPQAKGQLGVLIAAGILPELRWASFTDVRADVVKFYATGGSVPAWVSDGEPTPQARAMIGLFKQASLKGLNSEDYDGSRWDARMAGLAPAISHPGEAKIISFDLALTICAIRYLSALRVGRVNPQHSTFRLNVGTTQYDVAGFLRDRILHAHDVEIAVTNLEPHYQGYDRAETALASYLQLAAQGDIGKLSVPAKSIHRGDTYAEVEPLTARLRQLGDLAPGADVPAGERIYEGAMVDAVKHFQERHGLRPDGILGKQTAAQLDVPLAHRVKQLQFALERYRWIPSDFPQPPVIVNIPEFILRTMRQQPAPYLRMRVVVGKAYRHRTPVFADSMRYVIFRPYWEVPLSIQFAELVPKIRRARNYLADHGFEVTTEDGTLVTDGTISDDVFRKIRTGELLIRQKPGPKNALGLVKFIFPNHYNVYLHSTPAPELFQRPRRDFSHGCIRVEKPVELAAWVLRDHPEWTVDKINAVMNGDRTIQVNLDRPIPVLILYSTAVVEPDDQVRFFDDIYGLDAAMEVALSHGYPFSD